MAITVAQPTSPPLSQMLSLPCISSADRANLTSLPFFTGNSTQESQFANGYADKTDSESDSESEEAEESLPVSFIAGKKRKNAKVKQGNHFCAKEEEEEEEAAEERVEEVEENTQKQGGDDERCIEAEIEVQTTPETKKQNVRISAESSANFPSLMITSPSIIIPYTKSAEEIEEKEETMQSNKEKMKMNRKTVSISSHSPTISSPSLGHTMPYITSAELRSHNSPSDLWVSINGIVYDLTSWLPYHPGGRSILLNFAGHDISDAFFAFHPPETASSLLPSLMVSKLSDYSPSPLSIDYRHAIADLHRSGLFSVNLSPYFSLFFCLASLFLFCIYGVFLCHGTFMHMASAVSLGFFWSQTSFIMHDYGHSPFLKKPNLDRNIKILLACFFTGLSPSWWKKSHNAHHVSTNNLSHDPDVQFIPFFAISSKFFSSLYSYYHNREMIFDRLSRFLVSYQHWTFYPIMLIARINLLVQAFVFFLNSEDYKGKRMEMWGILSFWLWFSAILLSLPSNIERLGFLLVSCGVTSIQHLQFCLNHFACEVSEGMPKGGEFLERQVKGTLNIDCHRFMDWFHGGLQFQLEHHLFPRLPRHNLRKVSTLTKALCHKHGLPYVSVGFWRANIMLFDTLKNAAMEARDWKNPVLGKNLAWELINAQG